MSGDRRSAMGHADLVILYSLGGGLQMAPAPATVAVVGAVPAAALLQRARQSPGGGWRCGWSSSPAPGRFSAVSPCSHAHRRRCLLPSTARRAAACGAVGWYADDAAGSSTCSPSCTPRDGRVCERAMGVAEPPGVSGGGGGGVTVARGALQRRGRGGRGGADALGGRDCHVRRARSRACCLLGRGQRAGPLGRAGAAASRRARWSVTWRGTRSL